MLLKGSLAPRLSPYKNCHILTLINNTGIREKILYITISSKGYENELTVDEDS